MKYIIGYLSVLLCYYVTKPCLYNSISFLLPVLARQSEFTMASCLLSLLLVIIIYKTYTKFFTRQAKPFPFQ